MLLNSINFKRQRNNQLSSKATLWGSVIVSVLRDEGTRDSVRMYLHCLQLSDADSPIGKSVWRLVEFLNLRASLPAYNTLL